MRFIFSLVIPYAWLDHFLLLVSKIEMKCINLDYWKVPFWERNDLGYLSQLHSSGLPLLLLWRVQNTTSLPFRAKARFRKICSIFYWPTGLTCQGENLSCCILLLQQFLGFVSSGTFSCSLFEHSLLLTPSVTSQLSLVSQPSRFFCFVSFWGRVLSFWRKCLLGISEILRA